MAALLPPHRRTHTHSCVNTFTRARLPHPNDQLYCFVFDCEQSERCFLLHVVAADSMAEPSSSSSMDAVAARVASALDDLKAAPSSHGSSMTRRSCFCLQRPWLLLLLRSSCFTLLLLPSSSSREQTKRASSCFTLMLLASSGCTVKTQSASSPSTCHRFIELLHLPVPNVLRAAAAVFFAIGCCHAAASPSSSSLLPRAHG
uniref:Uncharacterized protein LOC104229691 n=1 Tax=Nicotiana sylvestris TaxID=4096 RepID=A0A1U7WL29_NICSY|nr:PREDICTED: uncharacterized protein LOC104229691 [Nicotiana sylvestris]